MSVCVGRAQSKVKNAGVSGKGGRAASRALSLRDVAEPSYTQRYRSVLRHGRIEGECCIQLATKTKKGKQEPALHHRRRRCDHTARAKNDYYNNVTSRHTQSVR